MKKAAFKFKPGSGAIFAFLILAFVFASIAAVVYVVISQSPGKAPSAAAGDVAVNQPSELICNGTWKTFKPLGKSRPQALASYNDRLIAIDYQPFPGSQGTPQYLRAWEFNPNTSVDTGWYEIGVKDSQGSLVLKEEEGKLNLYAYGQVTTNRIILLGRYVSEKRWSQFKPVSGVYMGNTGPDTASLGGKLYRIVDSLPDSTLDPSLSDSNGYLQECTGNVEACRFWPTPAAINGKNSSVLTDGGLKGDVYLKSNGVYTRVGTAFSNGDTGTFSIPTTVSPGTYELTVGNNPGVVCKHPSGQATIEVRSVAVKPTPTPLPTTPPAISCSQVDFDRDGSVTILDLTLMSNATGTKVGDANYNDAYDLNHDGTITKADMDIASGFFGQKCLPQVID